MNVAFIRHGPTHWNALGRMQGRRDIPLSAAGRRAIAQWRVPDGIAFNARWLSSPLVRAVETARHLAGAEPVLEPALTEMDWGAWEGYRHDELARRDGDAFTRNTARGLDFRPPDGESPRDVVARVARWLATVESSQRPLVCVTHNGVLGALLVLATGWDMTGKPPIRLRPATVHRFEIRRGPTLAVVECNIALVAPGERATEPLSPPLPVPSGALP
jgi:probable phosphoglycerate mutase